MSDLRQAAQQAREGFEKWAKFAAPYMDISRFEAGYSDCNTDYAWAGWQAALAQPQQQAEPVAHAVVAGALFDFMGWLTTRKERLVLSSTDNASPAADAIKDFAEMRGLSLDDARVKDWQAYTTPPQQQAEPVAWGMAQKNGLILDVICPDEHQSYEGEYTIPLYTTLPQHKPLTCAWSPEDDDTMPGTYRSACGELWSFIDGGWKDNRVRYCHGCGGKVVEAAHNIKEGP